MQLIHKMSQSIASKAESIEYDIRGYNPGTGRTPISITDLKNKCIGVQELLADLIDMLDEKSKNGIF